MPTSAVAFFHEVPPVGWLGGTVAVLTILTFVFKGIRFVVRLLLSTAEFLDDWKGEPARAGAPARPGVLERVASLEAQLRTNGGLSLRDQTNRIEAKLNAHITASGDHS